MHLFLKNLFFRKFSFLSFIISIFSENYRLFFTKVSHYFFAKFSHYFFRVIFAYFFREIFALFFREYFAFFREIFPFSISRKFRIFSRNRLKRNFTKKVKIFAFFVSEDIHEAKFSRNDFSFSLETLHAGHTLQGKLQLRESSLYPLISKCPIHIGYWDQAFKINDYTTNKLQHQLEIQLIF